jgi:hypothetical protein
MDNGGVRIRNATIGVIHIEELGKCPQLSVTDTCDPEFSRTNVWVSLHFSLPELELCSFPGPLNVKDSVMKGENPFVSQ